MDWHVRACICWQLGLASTMSHTPRSQQLWSYNRRTNWSSWHWHRHHTSAAGWNRNRCRHCKNWLFVGQLQLQISVQRYWKKNVNQANEWPQILKQMGDWATVERHLLWVIANRVRFLDDVVFHWRLLAGAQRKQKRSIRMNEAALSIGLRPWDIGESAAYVSVGCLCDHKHRRHAITEAMECGRRKGVRRCTENQAPVLFDHTVPGIQCRLQVELVVFEYGWAGE